METVLVQINNSKAYKLLEDLEDLQILKVLKKSIGRKQKLSEKFGGKLNLSEKEYNEFKQILKDARNDCERSL